MDKEALTRGGAGPQGLPTAEVPIPDVGTVTVRALNRGELIEMGKRADRDGQAVAEQYMLSCALLDPAGMTMADVADWQASSVGMEMHDVVLKVNEMSGATKESLKSDLPADGDGPGD